MGFVCWCIYTNIPFCLPLPTLHTWTKREKEKGLPAFVGSSFGVHDSEWIVCPLLLCPLLFFSSSFLHPFVSLVEISKEIKTKSYSSILMLLEFCWYMWVQNSTGKYYQKTNTWTHSLIGKGLPSTTYSEKKIKRRSYVNLTSSVGLAVDFGYTHLASECLCLLWQITFSFEDVLTGTIKFLQPVLPLNSSKSPDRYYLPPKS